MNIVVDTNILFSALYDPDSNAGLLIMAAIDGVIDLYAPDTVKEEITRTVKNKLSYTEEEAEELITSLPVKWIESEAYASSMPYAKTQLSHENDVPILACALMLGYDIVSGDKHLLNIKPEIVKVWALCELVKKLA
ncbi:MAG: PIN domain-containing protein [Thermoplasmata archaeon]